MSPEKVSGMVVVAVALFMMLTLKSMIKAKYGRVGGLMKEQHQHRDVGLILSQRKISMIEPDKVLLHALPGTLRITICESAVDPFTYEKKMSPRAMRILAINLFQAAEEQESNVAFTKQV